MTKKKGPFECVCKACGIIFESRRTHKKWCDDARCQSIKFRWNNRLKKGNRKRRMAKMQTETKTERKYINPFRPVVKRPWTSGCIMNLWEDIKKEKTEEYTAKETKRPIEAVKKMREEIEKHGYDGLKKRRVKEERNISRTEERSVDYEDYIKFKNKINGEVVIDFFDYKTYEYSERYVFETEENYTTFIDTI